MTPTNEVFRELWLDDLKNVFDHFVPTQKEDRKQDRLVWKEKPICNGIELLQF